LLRLAASQFLSQLAHVVLPSTFVLYATYRYGWSERAVGLALAAVGACSMIVQAGLVGAVVRRVGDRWGMMLGLGCGAIGFTAYGLAPSCGWFFIGVPLMSLWGLAAPAMQGLMTARVGAGEQGQLQGANSSLQGLAGLFGPTLFTMTFSLFIGSARGLALPGAPFLLAACLLVAAAAISFDATLEPERAS
jgi:DHA1 family tetracycline resistance protein-like MFS transporter